MENKALRLGDPAAFEVLFRQLYPRLTGYCCLFVHDKQQVRDMVQDCFMKLWEKRGTLADERSVEALLYTMLRNRCLNHLRDNQRITFTADAPEPEINELQYLYQLDFTGREHKSLEEQLIEAIREAIDHLPEKRRLVFIKSKIEGIKQQAIAHELGISLKMVEKHIHLARQNIKAEVEKKFPSYVVIIGLILELYS